MSLQAVRSKVSILRAVKARTDPRENGFMYVEVLLAMALFAIALLAIIPLFLLATRENTAAGDITLSATAAQDKAEELKIADYASMTTGSDTIMLDNVTFNRTWTVQDNVPHANMKTVTITVASTRQAGFGTGNTTTLMFYRMEELIPPIPDTPGGP